MKRPLVAFAIGLPLLALLGKPAQAYDLCCDDIQSLTNDGSDCDTRCFTVNPSPYNCTATGSVSYAGDHIPYCQCYGPQCPEHGGGGGDGGGYDCSDGCSESCPMLCI